jgi:hypothetical protein
MFNSLTVTQRRINFLMTSGILSVSFVVSCGRTTANSESELQWIVSGTMSDVEVDKALKATMAIRVNLTSNRATLYKNGEALRQWNIASADVTGQYHGGEPKFTPPGIYGVEDFEHCPVWRPRDPVNPATGRVAQTDDERWRIFNDYPEVYGPCGASNPLGRYVFWFQGPYGLHGNAAEYILRLPNPDDRRVSGGCLRSPNAEIKSLFHLALGTFSELAEYKSRVVSMEESPYKQTVAHSVRSLNMRVVVGHWRTDPLVRDSGSGRDPAPPVPVPPPAPIPAPIPDPVGPVMICKAIAIEPARGVAPVHRTLPATNGNVSAYYRLNDPVRIHGRIPGTAFYRTGRGYIEEKYIGKCAEI